VEIPEQLGFSFFYSDNYNKRFAIDFNPTFSFINELRRVNYGFRISPRYRVNNKILLIYDFLYFRQNNDAGWVDFDIDGTTIFARRDRIDYTNTIQGKYTLTNTMNISLLVRHYWSYVNNTSYLTLLEDGTFDTNFNYIQNKEQNFNTWNLDLTYSWWFTPGSQVSVLYRNNSALFSREFSTRFENNLNEAISNENLNHIFSLSIRYFIDYNSLKKNRSK
jgi:hypothetical protein